MGLGREVARHLASAGARVMIAGRTAAALDAALAELEGAGHERLRLDVSNATAWPEAMVRLDAGGALHGLVTAAGVLAPTGEGWTSDNG